MTENPVEITWARLRDRARTTPQKVNLDLAVAHLAPDPYNVFVDLLDQALRWSAQNMARNKNIFDELNEDQLTMLLLAPLQGMGFFAYHDANIGGHCDISVEFDDDMIWLGEAKKHSDYGTLYGGFQQLADRYSTGLRGQDCGGFVIYIRNRDAGAVMRNWMEYLGANFPGIASAYDNDTLLGSSSHPHSGSGRLLHVGHYPVVLHHQPTDTEPPPARK